MFGRVIVRLFDAKLDLSDIYMTICLLLMLKSFGSIYNDRTEFE